ncbi:MAG: AbrB/MazE/SpoVT family DNA-binding domain-containing protein [Patescibacteria group bacterium]|nr:AbrB/MazE/SpoVT family DNA-binding domain-containing protein [Patescibacteria group bacterium]
MTSSISKIYGTAVLNAKGQVVIPSEARISLGWKPGTRVVIMSDRDVSGVVILKSDEVVRRIKKS